MKQHEKGDLVNGTPFLQMLAISTSGFSMAAIIILLVHYDDQPIFDWNGITLNAIIAVLSAISKATLAYTLSECLGQAKWIWFAKERPLNDIDLIDSGSRGPLGSFKILTQSVGHSFISMGAIIIILSVAIDPFVQLTLGRRVALKYEENSNVQIAYAQRYDQGYFDGINSSCYGDVRAALDFLSLDVDADIGMKSAVTYGLSQPGSLVSQQIQYTCPSGNCTWETFMSLAICSGCNDLTNQLEEDAREEPKTYRLPNGLRSSSPFSGLMRAYGTGNKNNSVSFTSHDTLIWSMTMMNSTGIELESWHENYTAIECGLWYCVNSYNSAVKDGILTEFIQPAPSVRKSDSWQPFVKPENLKRVRPSDEFSKSINLFDISTLSQYDGDGFGYSFVGRTDLQLGEGFNLSQTAIYSFSKLLNNTFVLPDFGGEENMDGMSGNAFVLLSDGGSLDTDRSKNLNCSYAPTAMQNLYHSQNLEETFASLAQSMTNHIRQNSVNNTVVYGKEGKNVVLIRIQPRFLILPVILIFGGVVFLAMILYSTYKNQIPFWGTHTLPIVALGGRMGPIFEKDDMKASKMEQKAKRKFIQFPSREPDVVDSRSRSENREVMVASMSSRTSAMANPSDYIVSIVSLQSGNIADIVQRRSSDEALSLSLVSSN